MFFEILGYWVGLLGFEGWVGLGYWVLGFLTYWASLVDIDRYRYILYTLCYVRSLPT
jgi:hypothetical protein